MADTLATRSEADRQVATTPTDPDATPVAWTGRLDQKASRTQRMAIREALIAAADFEPTGAYGSTQFDVYLPVGTGAGVTRLYLGRVGQSGYGDWPEPTELFWDYKFAGDVGAGQPWQSGRGLTTREEAAYRLLPATI